MRAVARVSRWARRSCSRPSLGGPDGASGRWSAVMVISVSFVSRMLRSSVTETVPVVARQWSSHLVPVVDTGREPYASRRTGHPLGEFSVCKACHRRSDML
ncbi:hypothetical protein GCM10022224_063940 [Nonomuraea antimicrobica]|uniref:Secreted protein n=1 Tax=Nonomuraea antimicrobica TaxID=561173 RepID=A0ABP7CFW6_9ACTN